MSKKNRCKRMDNRQTKRQEVIDAMAKFQSWGMVGESKETEDDIAWEITPEQQVKWQAWAQEIFSHPERWDEVPAFKKRKAELLALREEAIKSGYVTIEE